MVANMQVNGW